MGSLFHVLGLVEDNVVTMVHAHLPTVFGMCFLNVDAEKVDSVLEPLENTVEAPGLLAKRGSSVRTEYECDWFIEVVSQVTCLSSTDATGIDEL